MDSNPHVYSPKFLEWLRNKIPNSTLSIVFMNSMKYRSFCDMNYFNKYFDELYSIDKQDAESFGMKYIFTIHSRQEIYMSFGQEPKYDLLFVGADKGRGEYLKKYFKLLKEKGYNPTFNIINLDSPLEGMQTKRITHKENLKRTKDTKAILEWIPNGANILTLRFAEAIMYNKILITNSVAVKSTPFYPNESIYYFESIDDLLKLDVDFNKKAEYNYNAEFSPLVLLTDISKNLGEKVVYKNS